MPICRSSETFWYRTALYLAFIAIYLLFAGPLLSQLQAAQQLSSANHTALCSTSSSPASSTDALHHWDNKCDYCLLWQQFPTSPTSLPAIARQAFLFDAMPCEHSPLAFFPGDHYPHARPRAPPSERLETTLKKRFG